MSIKTLKYFRRMMKNNKDELKKFVLVYFFVVD